MSGVTGELAHGTPAATADPAADPGVERGARRPDRRVVLRWVLVAVGITVALSLLAVLLRPDPGNQTPGDPENTGQDGSAALVGVARAQGIDVEIVRGADALAAATLDGDTTVVVSQPSALGSTTGPDLLEATAGVAGLVLLGPAPGTLDLLGLPVRGAATGPQEALEPGCDLPLARQGPRLTAESALVYGSDVEGAQACFTPTETQEDGLAVLLALPAADDRAPVSLFGAPEVLQHQSALDSGHAGLGLRLLFPSPRVVWYVPVLTDDLTAAQGIGDALPDATVPALWVLGAAVLALALVQGRRLGPLVRESLPVVVRSTETTLHRSRLYRQARDHERALAALQWGTRRRLSERLSLGTQAGEQALVRATAARTGRAEDDVRHLLRQPTAHDEATLVSTARRLAELEEEVRP